jgi:hypothetical protein
VRPHSMSFHFGALVALALGSLLAFRIQGTDEVAFKISTSLAFKERIVSESLSKSDIPALLDLAVRNGSSDLAEGYGVEMTRSNGGKFTAFTCREWKRASQEGAYSATTYDMAMESHLIHTCGHLFQLQTARVPVKSFVADPKVTLANLDLLPAEMLTIYSENGDKERLPLRGRTIAQVVPAKNIEEAKDTILRLTFHDMGKGFWEAARADFDGAGFEQIFVFTGGRAEGGTLGYADNVILTRTSPMGPLKVVKIKRQSEK